NGTLLGRSRVTAFFPTTSRSAPAALSIAFPTFMDFGNPDPYSHARESRISNPARRIDSPMRSWVRDPANTTMCPPGLRTRMHSSHTAGGGTNASHDLPMKPRPVGTWFRSPLAHFVMVSATEPGSVFDSPYGGSVMIASTDSGGMAFIVSMQSPW